MEVVVEVFEQGQRRSFLRRYQAESISVGRGWDNDVIVRDPLVDANHLQIKVGEGGIWSVEDLGSTNGTRVGRSKITGAVTVEFGKIISLGHSQIRLHRVDQEVAPTVKISRFDEVINRISHPAVALMLALIAVIIGVHADILGNPSQTTWSANASQGLTIAAGLVGWALVWGSVARLLRHEMTFFQHLSLVSLLSAGSICSFWLLNWITFNTLSLTLHNILSGVFLAALLFGGLLAGLAITIRMSYRHMLSISAGVAFVAISLLYILPALEEDENRDRPQMVLTVQSPGFLIAGSKSSETFLQQVDQLFERLDAKLAEDEI